MSTKSLVKQSNKAKKQTFFQRNKYVLLAFIFPFLLMTFVFASKGVSPFGDKQILVTDLWHQYYPFLVDFQSKLQSGGSLFYTWSVGLGTNYLSLMSYYLASPLNFLSVLVPPAYLREFLMFSVVAKMALASCFFAMFLRYVYKKNDLSITFFSVLFGLCAFFMGYYWNVIWLDTVAITPLVVMGTVALLREGKFKLYIISLAVAIMANYYIGLFLCYFTLLVYIGYTICNWEGFKKFRNNLFKMAGYTTISILITAILTIPAFLGLQKTYSSENSFETTFRINQFGEEAPSHNLLGVLQSIGKILTNTLAFIEPNPKDTNMLPNIYCGVIAIVLAIVFFASNKIGIKEKIFSGCLLGFITLSFIIRHLDFIWHGFHFTNMIPYRFSFLFSFVLICLAFRAYQLLDKSSFWDALIAALFMSLIILLALDIQPTKVILGSIAIIVVILGLIMLYSKGVINKNTLSAVLCVLIFVEMSFNGVIGVTKVTVTGTNDYPRGEENTARVIRQMKSIEGENQDLWRAEMTETQTLNDGALNGYRGVSTFSSMANVAITDFTQDLGLAGWGSGNRYCYLENSPVTDMFLNIKYLISRNGGYTNSYLEEITSCERVTLLRNTKYIPMGFMTNTDLLDYKVSDNRLDSKNPFDVQNEIIKLSTGINEDVYTPVEVTSQGHSDYEKFAVNKSSYGNYTFSTKTSGMNPTLKYNYEAPEDGLYFGYMKVSGCDNMSLLKDDISTKSFAIKRPYIMSLGEYKKGDKISFQCNLDENSSGSATVYCNYINDDVLENAYKKLSTDSMEITERVDTNIKGEINVTEDGLFYTSIPYEKGWTAKVDGEKVDITPVGNAMLAFELTKGDHEIELNYIPDGFILGLSLTSIGIFALIASIIIQRKYKKKKNKMVVLSVKKPTEEEVNENKRTNEKDKG